MEDEIVVVSRPIPNPPERLVSPRPRANTLPDGIAVQLEEWYNYMGRGSPPPCAVGPRIKSRPNQFKSDRSVFWSYMGLEEVDITTYELAEFKEDKNRHIIVAQGRTKGPFIIKCLQPGIPFSYHIWEGLNGRYHGFDNGFEPGASIIRCVRLQENVLQTTETVAAGFERWAVYDRSSPRVLGDDAQTQNPVPELSGYVAYPQLLSSPQMTRSGTKPTLAQEKSSDEAQDAIPDPSSSRSATTTNDQEDLLVNQGWNHNSSALRTGSHTTLHCAETALPVTADRNNNQIPVAETPHPAYLTQWITPSNVPAASMVAKPLTIPRPTKLDGHQSVAGALRQKLNPLEQQMRSTAKSPDTLTTPPQSTFDKALRNRPGIEVQYLQPCQDVLDEIMHPAHRHLNQPFLQPVDPIALNVPTYFEIIQNPMDLSTIKQKLATWKYNSAEDFKNDMCLMFRNCRTFNRESDPVYKSGQLLKDLFLQLWAHHTFSNLEKLTLELDAQIVRETTEFDLQKEGWLTKQPFTPRTAVPARATQGPDLEESQVLSSVTEGADWLQTSNAPALDHCMPQKNSLPATESPERPEHPFKSSDIQGLFDTSNRKVSNPFCASPGSIDEHEPPDRGPQARSASPMLSDSAWETVTSSRESSYMAEMLATSEREFSRADGEDHTAGISTDDGAQEHPEAVCIRESDSAGENHDEQADGTSVQRQLTVHSAQSPCEARSQDLSEEEYPLMSSSNLIMTRSMNQSTSLQEMHDCDGTALERKTSEHALGVRHQNEETLRTDQALMDNIEEGDHDQLETVYSEVQLTSSCPVQPDPARSAHDSSPESSEEASGSEYHESPSPHATQPKYGPAPLHCSHDSECRKTFSTKYSLNKHIKTVYLSTKKRPYPSCGHGLARSNYLNLHLRGGKCLVSRPLKSNEHTNMDRAGETRNSKESRASSTLSNSVVGMFRIDTAVCEPKSPADEVSLPGTPGDIISEDGLETAEEIFNKAMNGTDGSEQYQTNIAARGTFKDQLPEQGEQPKTASLNLAQQDGASHWKKLPSDEEAVTETQRPTTDQEGSDVDASSGEYSDRASSPRDNSEAGVSKIDQRDSESVEGHQSKQKTLLVKLPVTVYFPNANPPAAVSPQDHAIAKISEVVDLSQWCEACNMPTYSKSRSSKTPNHVCRPPQGKERPDEGDVDGKGRCVEGDTPGPGLKRRKMNANGEYVGGSCQELRACQDSQPLPKSGKTREKVTTMVYRRCDNCGAHKEESNWRSWRHNPGRVGGYLCRPCAAYRGKQQLHRRPDEEKTNSVEKAYEETPMTDAAQGYDLDGSPATPGPPEQETIEDDGLTENPALTQSKMINPDQLRRHIRENAIFLFYTDTGTMTAAKSFGKCESVGKLFGQAIGAKVFGLEDEKLKAEGNVLKIRFGAGQSGVRQDLRVVEDDKESFEALREAIEQRDWWSERNEVVSGSGILEVRAAVKGK